MSKSKHVPTNVNALYECQLFPLPVQKVSNIFIQKLHKCNILYSCAPYSGACNIPSFSVQLRSKKGISHSQLERYIAKLKSEVTFIFAFSEATITTTVTMTTESENTREEDGEYT